MLIDFCTKKTFFFINNEAQGGRKRSFGAKTHITRKRKQRAFQPMWSEISKSNSFRGIFINICNYFPRGNPTLGASTISISFPVYIPEVLCVCRVNPVVILIRQSYQAVERQVLLSAAHRFVLQPLDHELVSSSFQFSNPPPLRLCITIILQSHMYGF